MSNTANPAGPSLAPELAMAPAGSRVGISPALSHVMEPPIWTSAALAVLVVAPTLPPALGALVRLLLGLAMTALFLAVVAVTLRAVVVVAFAAAAVVDVSPGTVELVSAVGAAVVSLVTVVSVVLLLAVPFLLPPPHAAAIIAADATTARPRQTPDFRPARVAFLPRFRSGMPVSVIDPPDQVQGYCMWS